MDWVFPAERLFSSPAPTLALLVGVVFGVVFGLLPGIQGKKGIILSLPFVISLDPLAGVAYLVAMHAVVHTCGTLPAVLIGVPTSTSEAAVVLDGYPLVKQGRAWEAIAATIAGSAAGGLVGAVALIAFIPIGLLLVPHIGSPEIMGLVLLGLLSVSALSGASLARGLIVAAFGLLIATVGFDGLTGAQRYTFGQLALAPGLNIAAVLAGLFVIPELLTIKERAESERMPVRGMTTTEIVKGMAIVGRRMGLVIRSSLIGVVVGFIPGIGSSVSVWMAYGHAVQTEPHDPPFGEGNVAGVLAAETANNSKEGGSFAPTLMFAVPGTSGMAIMILAFSYIGVDVGPRLVAQDPAFISMIGWIILLANLIAVPVCLAFLPTLSFVATLKQRAIMPVALMLSTVAAIVVMPHPISLLQIAIFGAIGLAFKLAGWPRAPLILGFVMGPILESTLSRTVAVFGASAFERPGLVIMLAIMLLVLAGNLRRSRKKRTPKARKSAPPAPILTGAFIVLFALAAYLAAGFPASAKLFPIGAAVTGIVFCLIVLAEDVKRAAAHSGRQRRLAIDPAVLTEMLGFLVLAPTIGLPAAVLVYVFVALVWSADIRPALGAVVAVASAVVAFVLSGDPIGFITPFDWLWLWAISL